MSLLEVNGLNSYYGDSHILFDNALRVERTEVVALLGRNGAGKSTTLHAISGLIAKRGGRIRFDGQDITGATPRDIVRAGLVQVLEGHRVFHPLTVEDNLLIGTYARAPHGDRAKLPAIYDLFPELAERRKTLASRLSGGQAVVS